MLSEREHRSQSRPALYQQIADALRDAIVSGELTAGQKLPSEREGRSWHVEILEFAEVEAPAGIAARLWLGEGGRAFVRRRRMWMEDYPMSLGDSYFPLDIAEGTAIMREDTGPGGVYARIEEKGIMLTRFEEELRARMPTPDEARSLHLAPGVPVFDLVRTAFAGDRAVEILVSAAAADKHVFHYAFPAE